MAGHDAQMTGRVAITLPDPCLVVIIGAAGAGKSTFASRHFEPSAVLSSDAFRERIAGDPRDQGATRPAFAALHRALARRLGSGLTTVVDATSATVSARHALIGRARAGGAPAVAIVLDLPDDVVLARNATRGDRAVPVGAVLAQLRGVARTRGPGHLEREGFAAVIRLSDPASVEAVRIVRGR